MSYQTQPWGAPPPPAPMRRPWHTKTGWIILLLVVFAPVGIFLLYRAGIWRGAGRHIISGVAALWFVIIAVGSASGGSDDKEADKPATPAAVTSTVTTPAAPSSSPAPPTEAAPVVVTSAPEPTTAEPSSAPPVTVAPPAPVETQPAPPPVTKPAAPATTKPAPPPTTRRPTTSAPPPPVAVSYKNCDAVRAAGAAPIHRGDPGYGTHLDRDEDGIGCEK